MAGDGTREPRETRMLSEWIGEHFPNSRVLLQVKVGIVEPRGPLGPLTPAERRAIGVNRRYADAIIIEPERLVLIEASVKAKAAKLGDLLVYSQAIPFTEELEEFRNLPIQAVLLSGIEDMFLRMTAEKMGFEFHVFQPVWLTEYLQKLDGRKSTASQMSVVG